MQRFEKKTNKQKEKRVCVISSYLIMNLKVFLSIFSSSPPPLSLSFFLSLPLTCLPLVLFSFRTGSFLSSTFSSLSLSLSLSLLSILSFFSSIPLFSSLLSLSLSLSFSFLFFSHSLFSLLPFLLPPLSSPNPLFSPSPLFSSFSSLSFSFLFSPALFFLLFPLLLLFSSNSLFFFSLIPLFSFSLFFSH